MNKDNLCMVCYDKFEESNLCCLCVNSHIIHKNCHLENMKQQSIINYNLCEQSLCAYCRQKVPVKIYKLTE